MISNNSVPSDGLGPHDDLLEEFPYLGTPFRIHLRLPRRRRVSQARTSEIFRYLKSGYQ